ncbi:tripartite tricarboxylate transporter TctB family protein [Cloacibacillus porcorum]|uniref:tripartite tricarboxylate transporter TctB family protein n=1 Tax=Cloacibacillus porcorum TaxID=1197717 RepID=UPI0023F111E3|nr:tripartite tricarboxylate transporter TctB family protein [Cloacibacillus porcorum]
MSVFCYIYVIPTYTADIASKNDFCPQMFPKIAIFVVGVAALGLILKELLANTRVKELKDAAEQRTKGYLQVFSYVFLYILSVTFVGFYSSSFVLAVIYFRKMPRKTYLVNILLVLILFCLIWFLFEKMMKVSLPTGLLV